MMVPCLASHALRTWDGWGCPEVRALLPDPSSHHRPTSVLRAARLGSRPRFLNIGYASFLPPLRPQSQSHAHAQAQFRPSHRLPHEVSPLRCPVPLSHYHFNLPWPYLLVVHCFTIPLTYSSWYLNRGGTDSQSRTALGFSASTLTNCLPPSHIRPLPLRCYARPPYPWLILWPPHTDIPSLLRIS
jgi:hypothetical protein